MSILQKQKERDPKMGYARDFIGAIESVLAGDRRARRARDRQRGRRESAGVRRRGATGRAERTACRTSVRIGVVTGDDLLPRLDELIAQRPRARQHGDGRAAVDRARSRALGQRVHRLGADRRSARARREHRHHRPLDRYGAHDGAASLRVRLGRRRLGSPRGGNHRRPHHRVRRAVLGRELPVRLAEHSRSRQRRLSDRRGHRPTGRSSSPSIRTPAGGSRFSRSPSSSCTRWAIRTRTSRPTSSPTSRRFASSTTGENRVRVFGIKGRPPTDKLKVSIAYRAGFKAVGTLVYSWPDALAKAQLADRVLRERLDNLGLRFDHVLTEFVGASATHGPSGGRSGRPAGSPAPLRCAWRGQGRRRAFHARDRAARAQRSAERDRIRRRPAQGRGDRRVLARADRQDRRADARRGARSEGSPARHRARPVGRQG